MNSQEPSVQVSLLPVKQHTADTVQVHQSVNQLKSPPSLTSPPPACASLIAVHAMLLSTTHLPQVPEPDITKSLEISALPRLLNTGKTEQQVNNQLVTPRNKAHAPTPTMPVQDQPQVDNASLFASETQLLDLVDLPNLKIYTFYNTSILNIFVILINVI